MKELHIDTFDCMLSVASAYCVRDEAASFLAADVSSIAEDPRLKRRILRGRQEGGLWHSVRIACLACLICVALAFTACMCVPDIRHVIWNTVVEWYDDHVKISFGNAETQATEPGDRDTDHAVRLTYVPDSCYKGDETMSAFYYTATYYDSTDSLRFLLTRGTLEDSEWYVDNESTVITETQINSYPAILAEYTDDSGVYMLIWQDAQYSYMLYGHFDSTAELIRVAEGIVSE